MKPFFYILIWCLIVLLAGIVGRYFFHLDFWLSSLIAGLTLVVNGLIAEWEDRKKGAGGQDLCAFEDCRLMAVLHSLKPIFYIYFHGEIRDNVR